jgi:hypothetical protein
VKTTHALKNMTKGHDNNNNGNLLRLEIANAGNGTRQHWVFEKGAEKGYRIARQSTLNPASVSIVGTGALNVHLWQELHTNHTQQRWFLVPVNNQRNVRIFFDSSYENSHPAPASLLNAAFFSGVALGFFDRFGVVLNRLGNTVSNGELNGMDCPQADRTRICDTQCGNGVLQHCSADFPWGHHKSSIRLINQIAPHPTAHTIRVVGHVICMWDSRENPPVHRGHYGLGGPCSFGTLPRESLVSSVPPPHLSNFPIPLQKLMQHEIMHNLGVSGHCDSNGQPCVMKSELGHVDARINRWCSSCRNTINSNKHRL